MNVCMKSLGRRLSDFAIWFVALAALAACGDNKAGSLVTVWDSAGITIVESGRPDWDRVFEVDSSPVVDLALSGPTPAHEFFYVTDAAILSDGSFAVADAGSNEIRVFSANGTHTLTIGREGEGPGEFRRLTQVIAHSGDSILAYDFMLSRVTIFGPDGNPARIVTLKGASQAYPIFPLPNGGYVLRAFDYTTQRTRLGLRRIPSPILRVSNAGEVIDTITSIPGHESVVYSRGDAGALWGKQGHLATHGGNVFLGWADSLAYQVWSQNGKLLRIVRVPGFDLSLTPKQIEREIRAYMPDPAKASPTRRAIMEVQPSRTHRPAYGKMVVDTEGYVWLRAHQGLHERNEKTLWQVFAPSGSWSGTVVLPSRFTVFRIGEDWILGMRPDDLDVEHIQLLRLHRSP